MTTAIILAGGLGTRLRSVLPDLPKPMAPINERPFLEHQLDYWIKQGINHFVLSVGYLHEVIIDHFGSSYNGVKIDYVVEQTPLGTGGGLLLAAKTIGENEPFLVLNGDTYFAVDLKVLIKFSSANKADWCFSLFRTSEEGRYMGMDVSPSGKIISLKSGTGQLANGGVYWVSSNSVLPEISSQGKKLSLEDDIFSDALVSGQRLFGVEFEGTFIDIGVPEDYHRASTVLAL